MTGYPKGKKCARRDFTLRVTVVEDGLSALRVRLDRKTLTDRAVAAATTERFSERPGEAAEEGPPRDPRDGP